MDTQPWIGLNRALEELLELDQARREQRIVELADGDARFEALLRRALALDTTRIPILDSGVRLTVLHPEGSELCTGSTIEAGTRIGAWKLERELGRGGMGTIWLAFRDDGQYRLEVAIKLIDGLADSPLLREQLRKERQILADLDHPGIARLVDGGVCEDGKPWYAMEYIHGQPLDIYCREHNLEPSTCLRLLIPIARAVHHAHTQLIVHRDLKPGNILIDRKGRPHLLDFGIARLLHNEAATAGPLTLLAASTPAYAAPEQRRGRAVGTSADIYALGVIAYELITGERPAAVELDTPPDPGRGPLPSQALRNRKPLRARVQGDIDAIVSKALAPDPECRYASAEALARDLERHFSALPVDARGVGPWYRAGKFIQRHWLGVGLSSAAIIALCLSLAYSVVQTQKTTAALERERIVQSFLLDVFDASTPAPGQLGVITQRELAERAVERLDELLGEQSDARIDVLIAVARVFRKLGFPERTRELLQRSLDLLEGSMTPPQDPRWVSALGEFGEACNAEGDFENAIRALAQADLLAQSNNVSPAGHAQILQQLAFAYSSRRRLDLAASTFTRAEALARLDPAALELLPKIRLESALNLRRSGRLDEAIRVGIEAIDLARKAFGNADLRTASALNTVGAMHLRAGDAVTAELLLREALEVETKTFGEPQPATVNNLGTALSARGLGQQAGKLLERALQLAQARYGPATIRTASYRRNLALHQSLYGQTEAALANIEAAYTIYRSSYGPDEVTALEMRADCARILSRAGQHERALELLPEIFEHTRGRPGDAELAFRRAHLVAARAALAQDQPGRAREHLDAAEANLDRWSLEAIDLVELTVLAGDVLAAEGQFDLAHAQWRQAARLAQDRLGPTHPLHTLAMHRSSGELSVAHDGDR